MIARVGTVGPRVLQWHIVHIFTAWLSSSAHALIVRTSKAEQCISFERSHVDQAGRTSKANQIWGDSREAPKIS